MREAVQLIASCTAGKTVEVPPTKRLRAFAAPRQSMPTLADRWWDALFDDSDDRRAAATLYKGQHWNAVLRAAESRATRSVQLWVASAGLGLVRADAEIPPYSATFATSDEDAIGSVIRGSGKKRTDVNREWWNLLVTTELPGHATAARSVEEIADSGPGHVILIAAGPAYVSAMEHDLLRARDRLNDPAQLLIVTSPGPATPVSLRNNVVPSVARLAPQLGGARVSLHARLAEAILSSEQDTPLRADLQRAYWEQIAGRLDAPRTRQGRKASEAEVVDFIRRSLARDPRRRYTPMLRELRASGLKFEQNKFRRIHERFTRSESLQ